MRCPLVSGAPQAEAADCWVDGVPHPAPALLTEFWPEGGGPQPVVPLDMAEVSPGSGAPPRSPPPRGAPQPWRRAGNAFGAGVERQGEAPSPG